jgi:hypothetical protein
MYKVAFIRATGMAPKRFVKGSMCWGTLNSPSEDISYGTYSFKVVLRYDKTCDYLFKGDIVPEGYTCGFVDPQEQEGSISFLFDVVQSVTLL